MSKKRNTKKPAAPAVPAVVPRTISFQPIPSVRVILEKVRREQGLRDRTGLINEAIVVHFRTEFGKEHAEEIGKFLAEIKARKEKASA